MMLKSLNRDDWKEDPHDLHLIDSITIRTDRNVVRRLYPLQGKLKVNCHVTKLAKDSVIHFVRTKRIPAYYPFEALVTENGMLRRVSYNPEEMEIGPVEATKV